MYTREIQAPKPAPVEDGKPLIGTWDRAFDRVNLQDIHKPYSFPLPMWAKNCRIKEWHYFSASDGGFLFEASFYNLKFYRIARVLAFDNKSGENFLFRKIMPGAGWTLRESLFNSSVDNGRAGNGRAGNGGAENRERFFFRIQSRLDAGVIKLELNTAASRAAFSVNLSFNAGSSVPMAVSLGIAGRGSEHKRSMYAFKTLAPVSGEIDFMGKRAYFTPETCSGLFCDYKGYFPFHTRAAVCGAAGFNNDGGRFGFHIAETQTREQNKNNENALWTDGKLTPLPPVRITMPNGINDTWVIQDVEGMIDLMFTPKEQNKNIGYYNGMLLNREGEKIPIKNLLGAGDIINLLA